MADIGTAYVKIEPTAKGITAKLNDEMGSAGESGGKSFGDKFGAALGTAGKVVAGAVAAGTAAVGGFAAASVSAGASFDSAMAQVAATMGTTVDQIGGLRDFAQEMGSTTAFSASQAAEALNYMALAGYDADKSMEMLPGVLDLAAAGGIGLARASDMVTDAQSALGLSTTETKTMIDQMAKASSQSNTSVEQLGDAFLTIGATARNVKGGTQELSTVLGVLADNGIKGSEGGTHLRNMLLSLQNPTDKGAAALDQLGVAVYDADGNMRSMIDIVADMQKGLQGMDQASKDTLLNGIFNKTDLASANALLGTSQSRFQELTAAIQDSDSAAKEMANTQLDNLSGDITLFKSALEGAQIAVSDQLTPTLRDFVQFGTDGLSQLTQAFQEGGLDGAMEAFGTILSDGLAMIIEKLPSFVDAGLKLLEALGQGLLENLPMIIDATVKIAMTILDALLENLPTILDAGLQIIEQLALGIAQALPELVPTIVDCVLNIVDVLIQNAPLLLEAAMALIEGLAEGLLNSLPLLIEKLPELIQSIVDFLIEHIADIIVFAVELTVQLAAALIENIPTLIAALPEIIMALVNGLLEGISKIVEVGAEIVSGLWEGIKGAWGKLVENVTSLGSKLVDKVKGFFKIGSPSKLFANEIGKWIPEGIAVGINANADSVNGAVDEMVKDAMINPQYEVMTQTSNTIAPSVASGTVTYQPESSNSILEEYLPLLLSAIQNSGVVLEGDAKDMFRLMRKENNQFMKANGVSAFV